MFVSSIFEHLRERINEYSVGMIATKTGKEMRILERLFTEEEAEVYLGMTRSLEAPKTIAARCGKEELKTAKLLEGMTDKGLTFPLTVEGNRYYAAAPFMHGFFEQQLLRKEQDPQLAPLIEDYLMDGFVSQTTTLRAIPVGITIEPRDNILPYDNVRKIIESKDKIAVCQCFCRHHMEGAGKGSDCQKPHEMCLGFDFYAQCVVEEFNVGRYITREEALQILDEAEAAGLVHQTAGDAGNTEALCNCCDECCTVLRRLKLHPTPGLIYSTNYYCEHDPDLCIHCLTCIDRCPMIAIADEGEHTKVTLERCIGCSLCVSTCPTGAAQLFTKAEVKGPPEVSTFLRSSIDLMRDLQEEIKSTKG
jgi:electron transport complex protein RnfB